MIKHWVVVLGLFRLSVPNKVEKARFVVSSMSGNGNFTTPIPPLAEITAAADELDAAYIASRDSSTDKTAEMYIKEQLLELKLIEEGHYIEDTANKDQENAKAIILSAGVKAKNVPVHTARDFAVKNSDLPGKVLLRTRGNRKRVGYIWQYSPNPITASSWGTANTTTVASSEISGLVSGEKYFFRVAVVSGKNQGPWSDELGLIVL